MKARQDLERKDVLIQVDTIFSLNEIIQGRMRQGI